MLIEKLLLNIVHLYSLSLHNTLHSSWETLAKDTLSLYDTFANHAVKCRELSNDIKSTLKKIISHQEQQQNKSSTDHPGDQVKDTGFFFKRNGAVNLVDRVLDTVGGTVDELENGMQKTAFQDERRKKHHGQLETVVKVGQEGEDDGEEEEVEEPSQSKQQDAKRKNAEADTTSPQGSKVKKIAGSNRLQNSDTPDDQIPIHTKASKKHHHDGKPHSGISELIDSDNNRYVLTKPQDTSRHIEDLRLLNDIILLIILSYVLGILCSCVHVPPFFGYMVAGILLGPPCLDVIQVWEIWIYGI